MRVFSPGEDRKGAEDEILQGLDNPAYAQRFGMQYEQAKGEIELLTDAAPLFEPHAFLGGHQTPMFFGSAVNNFGVREVLDALVDLAPAPGSRSAIQRVVQPEEGKFTGVVFKIQANMDPAHRDRIAFVRVASGRFERGMRLKVVRSGKELRPNTVVTFMSQRRELLDEAFAGDIIGIPNHGVLQLGDSITEGESLQFTGLPFFAPEMFRSVEVADPLKTKQLARRPHAVGRRRGDPGLSAGVGQRAAAGRGGTVAVRGGGAPPGARIRLQGTHHAGALQRGTLGDLPGRKRRRQGTAALH
jgi:peptide chain release factor 3